MAEEGAPAIGRIAVGVQQAADAAAQLAQPARWAAGRVSCVIPAEAHHRSHGRAEDHEVGRLLPEVACDSLSQDATTTVTDDYRRLLGAPQPALQRLECLPAQAL